MIYFNACPRCKTGAVELRHELFGRALQCLQCSWRLDEEAVSPPEAEVPETKRVHEPAEEALRY